MVEEKDMKAVIPCAGSGVRLKGFTTNLPKSLILLKDEPLLYHILEKVSSMNITEIIIIVNYMKDKIINKFGNKFNNIPITYVIQKELHGLAHAIGLVRKLIKDYFIVMLGDEVYLNTNHEEIPSFLEKNLPDAICGIMKEENNEKISKNYSVRLENNLIKEIVEKPVKPFNQYIGVGTWVFNKTIFEYIDKTPPSKIRNEIELADVIQKMIDNGAKVMPYLLKGQYININSPQDLYLAKVLVK